MARGVPASTRAGVEARAVDLAPVIAALKAGRQFAQRDIEAAAIPTATGGCENRPPPVSMLWSVARSSFLGRPDGSHPQAALLGVFDRALEVLDGLELLAPVAAVRSPVSPSGSRVSKLRADAL